MTIFLDNGIPRSRDEVLCFAPPNFQRAAEVAWHLVDIFLLFGTPQILQSDNGSEFTASVITELKSMWPDLLMVHGKPRHPQNQESVERLNCVVRRQRNNRLSYMTSVFAVPKEQ